MVLLIQTKLPEVNNRPAGKKSTNMVTLLLISIQRLRMANAADDQSSLKHNLHRCDFSLCDAFKVSFALMRF
jgi:hypothetical protein